MVALQTNLAVLLVLFTPFIWGFIARFEGMLVRPTDLIVAAFYILIIARGRVHAPLALRVFYFLVIALVLSLILSTMVNGASTLWLLKAAALFPIPLIVHDTLARNDYQIPSTSLLIPVAVFTIAIMPILFFIGETVATGLIGGNMKATLWHFWHNTFETNIFGSESLEIKGQSARNGFARGALAALLFAYGFWQRGKFRTVAMVFFTIAVLAAFSRTGWATLAVFVILLLVVRRAYWLAMLVGTAVVAMGATIRETAIERITSRVGRLEDLPQTLETFNAHILFGDPEAIDPAGHIIMHNVPLSLGANFGILPFAFSLALTFFTLCAAILLYRLALRVRIEQRPPLIAATTAAFGCTVMPHVSAAGTNIYTLGELAMLGLVISGLTIRSRLVARPRVEDPDAAPLGPHPEIRPAT